MIEQLKTIREFVESVHEGEWASYVSRKATLAALTQLEAMVGEQEPVAWMGIPVMPGRYKEAVFCSDKDLASQWDYSGHTGLGRLIVTPLYAAPVAQQYEAGDMASAAAQGFRDGVASVAQPQEPVAWRAVLDPEQAPQQLKTTMHVVGFREKKAAEGFAAEQIDFYGWRYTIEPLYAAPVAQQPTFDARRALEAIEALLSNIRRDAPSLSGKVMGFAEEVAAALRDKVARQPQARPDFTDEWAGYLKDGETPFERFLRERKDLNALTKLYQRALEENERLKAQQPQAEAVPTIYVSRGQLENLKPDPEDEAGTYLPVRKTPKGKFTHPLFAVPQQAEAVSVVTDAAVVAGARALCDRFADTGGVSREDQWNIYAEDFKDDARAVLNAAIAQQKGRP